MSKYYSESESGFIASTGLEALDDCAVIPISKDYELIIGSDFIRGEGFTLYRKGVISLEDIGFYLIAANASDLAAMGALPVGVTVVFRYTQNMTDDDFSKVMIGVMKACKKFKLPLLGGDTGGYEKSVLSACAIGVCPRGRSLLRSKGKPGDSIYVTGDVGGAGAALSYFARIRDYGVQLTKSEEEELAKTWKQINPALEQGQGLVNEKLSRCAIDTSDGLKAACRQISESSGLDLILFPDKIPISPIARKIAQLADIDPLIMAISDSVDFRLVFSTPMDMTERLEQLFEDHEWPLYLIGKFEKPSNKHGVFFQIDNNKIPVEGHEWDQSDMLTIDKLINNRKPKGGTFGVTS